MTSTAVRVGLRVRPLTQKEQLSNCNECVSFIPNEPQILIGTDKSFTFDYVYDSNTPQAQVYTTAASPLMDKFLEGFNATILAYGQTGSGKTYSMGTSLENSANAEQEGIVPRCIVQLYRSLQERIESTPGFDYQVYVSFLELYNEELIDLLNPYNTQKRKGGAITGAAPAEVTIREDVAGNIYWSGVKEELCSGPEELLGFLAKGSLCRTTGSTDMNTVSSRSHAVFSVILKQTRPDLEDTDTLTSKFHFVDLAGSERLKRTNAQGDRAKEGIAINSGLLALGNVISALGDEHRRGSHVPYRDSKLTRLLQDSLGGNSQTLMLACVSPADANFMETLNTLKYANRARNIKNRVVINQDFAGSSIEVNQLRAQLARLRMENASLRAEGGGGGGGGNSRNNGASYAAMDENRALRNEVTRLRDRIQDLSTNLIQVTSERDTMVMERELGEFLKYEEQLDDQPLLRPPSYDLANNNNNGENRPELQSSQSILEPMSTDPRVQSHPLVMQYQKTIQDLNNELADTKDRLVFLENTKPPAPSSVAYQSSQLSMSSSTLSFSHSSHIGPRSHKANRRRRRPLMSSSSSTTTSGRRGTKPRRPHGSHSGRTQYLPYTEELDDEDDSYYDQQNEIIRNGVKDSIAKARDEIQKGMKVLELIKPLEDTAEEWENELKAFEEAEAKLYGDKDMNRMGSDEGNFTASPSPDGQRSENSFYDEIEALAVPNWDDDHKITKDISNDNTSISSSQGNNGTTSPNNAKDTDNTTQRDKHNPQLVRMLHQIQSDIRVKEELVSHLEKSETEYAFMRRKFDEKIGDLEAKLANLQREKNDALTRTKSGFAATNNSTKPDGAHVREKQQLIEIRHAYENKMKSLLSEIQDLRHKYSQTTMTMQSTRNQNDTLLRSLRMNVETLKMEKKRMIKRMKQEAERVREQMTLQDRKIHQLQRANAEANQARRRLEREHEAQKLTLKRRNEETLMNNNQLKQLTNILKKAVREGGVLDERLLAKVSKTMGGSFAIMARGGGLSIRTSSHSATSGRRRTKNPIPVHLRATRKKQLLDRALYQLIQGKQAIVEMEQLLFKRERLATEKVELAEERKQIYLAEKQNAERTGEPMDNMGVEFMDERIDMISAEISYLSARIRALQSEAAGEMLDDNTATTAEGPTKHQPEKRVTFADEIISDTAAASLATPHDEWMDMDAMEEQFNVPSTAAPEVAYDMSIKILKSLEVDECRRIAEGLMDDIVNVRTSECNRQVTMQNLERTVHDLRRTLIVMKRAAIATTVDNERRIRKLEGGRCSSDDEKDSAIDVKIEEYITNGNTIFDKIYEDGLRGMITTPEPGSTEYYPRSASTNGSPNGSYAGGGDSSVDEVAALLSPLVSPASTTGSMTSSSQGPTRPELLSNASTLTASKPPIALTEMAKHINRDTTPSPDRFFNMIQKRMSWQQQQQQRSESPMAISMINPAEFARYSTTDRESSTSSLRSSHFRRSSIQSDQSSSQHDSSNSSQGGSARQRAFSLQQPPVPTRRRASLRELSVVGNTMSTTTATPARHLHTTQPEPMSPAYHQQQPQQPQHLLQQSSSFYQQQPQSQYYYHKDLPASPRVSSSVAHHAPHHQQQRVPTLRRPSSVATFAPHSTTMNSGQTMERGSSAGGNVFDRLSQTPTRASSAKMQFRHSISSIEDLQNQNWDPTHRSSSVMSGTFYN